MSLSISEISQVLDVLRDADFHSVELALNGTRISVAKQCPDCYRGFDTPKSDRPNGNEPAAPGLPTDDSSADHQGSPSFEATDDNPRSDEIEEGLQPITASTVGVFYTAPSPGEEAFVSVGDRVNRGDTVGLIEVMKMFNAVEASVAGTVIEIRASNGQLVEFGDTLIVVRPDSSEDAS